MKKLSLVLAALFAFSAVSFANEHAATEETAPKKEEKPMKKGKKGHGAKAAKEEHTEEHKEEHKEEAKH